VETIAETVGWTRQTVRRHLVAAGFDLPAQPRGPRPAFDVDQAVEQAQAGMTVTQIARHHQVSVRTITSHLERRGVTPVNGRTAAALARSQHIDTDAIVKAYAAGASIPQVADQLGCATATVRRRLISAGVILRDDRHTNSGGRNQISAQTAQAAIDLYLSGLTGKEVGRRLGIGQTTVGRILRDHDITVRTSGQAQLGRVGRDNARDLKDLMAANGATTQDVRAWARRTGRPVADRGIPGRHLVEDYLLEHSRNPNHTKENRP
jgi:DNA-binding CsgD family transcriptional regulator